MVDERARQGGTATDSQRTKRIEMSPERPQDALASPVTLSARPRDEIGRWESLLGRFGGFPILRSKEAQPHEPEWCRRASRRRFDVATVNPTVISW